MTIAGVTTHPNPGHVQMLLYRSPCHSAPGHANSLRIPGAAWPSKWPPARTRYCRRDPLRPGTCARPARGWCRHQASGSRSTPHPRSPWRRVHSAEESGHASRHRPRDVARLAPWRLRIRGPNGCRCAHSAAQWQSKRADGFKLCKMAQDNLMSRLTFLARGCLDPVARTMMPFGSLVRNLKLIELCLPVSQGGRTFKITIKY